jgi:Fungal specific transcription factor domain
MDHFQMETADVLLDQACQLALDAGLHHENSGTFIYSPAEIKERRGLFWTLFVLDKNWSLIKGRNPYIPLKTCSIPFPAPDTTNEADNVLEKYFLVRIRLAMIQEQIFLDLYSSQGKRRQHTLESITVLDNLLQQWYKEHTALLDVSLLNGPQSALALEILFHYQNSRILVLSCIDEWSCQAACVNLSRECIMILQNLNQSRGIEKHSALHRYVFPFS